MMDAVNSGELCEVTVIDTVEPMDTVQVIKDFWDIYQEHGMVHATNFLDTATGGDIKELEAMIPTLMTEAQARSIDMVAFVKEWEENVGRVQAEQEQSNGAEAAAPAGV
jgi:hypothetical protein